MSSGTVLQRIGNTSKIYHNYSPIIEKNTLENNKSQIKFRQKMALKMIQHIGC